MKFQKKNIIYSSISIICAILVILFYINNIIVLEDIVFKEYIDQYSALNIENIVTAIYLDFRSFDTLFEALLLLVSVIAIFEFTNIDESEDNKGIKRFTHDNPSDYRLIKYTLSIIYPIFIMFGFYLIYNGADTPGGGFQGGSVLATLVMTRYLVSSIGTKFNIDLPYILEKVIYIGIIISLTYFLLYGIGMNLYREYIFLMNFLIGIKVSLGFTTIFVKLVKGDL